MEDETSKPAAALGAGICGSCASDHGFRAVQARTGQSGCDQTIGAKTEHDKVENHRVNERGGEYGVVGLSDDTTASLWGPYSLEKNALKDEGPVTQNEDDQEGHNVSVLRPDGHAMGGGMRQD